MINRILIRIKVVQILYSYLLSRSEFNIASAPVSPSRDRRFAYAVYLDMLCLIQELSGIRVNNPSRQLPAIEIAPRLATNRVARALADNEALKALLYKDAADLNVFAPLLGQLESLVEDSSYFKEYARKRSRNLDDDVKMWVVMLETVILKNPSLVDALRSNPDFSLAGFEEGVAMAVDTLNDYNDSRAALLNARDNLRKSLDEAYDLYFQLFQLVVELTRQEAERLDAARNKYLATSEDLNPDTRFVDNRFAIALEGNDRLLQYMSDHPVVWEHSAPLLKSLGDEIRNSDIYREYMSAPSSDWKTDCEFWRDIMRSIVLPSEALALDLEGKSVFWNDDLDIVGTFVVKTIRRSASSSTESVAEFLPQFKDEEDAAFGTKLFNAAVDGRETYREYIDSFINKDWDPERLAFMDIVIMVVALAEILNFPGIPVPVSLNEYIEIANSYSTPRSGSFINGILYSVVSMLASEGRLGKPFATR